MNELFPIFIKTYEVPIIIIGGSAVAYEKLFFLLKSSPHSNVTLVAEYFSPDLLSFLKDNTQVKKINRKFKTKDLKDKKIVIVAANNDKLNQRIRRLAKRKSFLLNVADTPNLCEFYLGGILSKGQLKLGISTNGKSPIMARRIREFFEDVIPDSIEETLETTAVYRKQLKGDFDRKLKKLTVLTKEFIKNERN